MILKSRSGTLHFFISERRAKVGRCALLQMQGTRSMISFPPAKREKKVNTSLSISGFLVGLDRHLPSFRIQLSIALVYEKGLVVAMSRLDTRSIRVCCHCSVYPYIEIRRDCFWERCSRCFENSSLFGLWSLHSPWWLGLGSVGAAVPTEFDYDHWDSIRNAWVQLCGASKLA